MIDVSNSPSFEETVETLIKRGGISYSIVHATQFFEFMKRIDEATVETTVRLPCEIA